METQKFERVSQELDGGAEEERPDDTICKNNSNKFKCRVDGCKRHLSREKTYFRRYRCCMSHSKHPAVVVEGQTRRWCQQCCCFHELTAFDGEKRNCRERLAIHNHRRNKRKNDPQGQREPSSRVMQTTSLSGTTSRQANMLRSGRVSRTPTSMQNALSGDSDGEAWGGVSQQNGSSKAAYGGEQMSNYGASHVPPSKRQRQVASPAKESVATPQAILAMMMGAGPAPSSYTDALAAAAAQQQALVGRPQQSSATAAHMLLAAQQAASLSTFTSQGHPAAAAHSQAASLVNYGAGGFGGNLDGDWGRGSLDAGLLMASALGLPTWPPPVHQQPPTQQPLAYQLQLHLQHLQQQWQQQQQQPMSLVAAMVQQQQQQRRQQRQQQQQQQPPTSPAAAMMQHQQPPTSLAAAMMQQKLYPQHRSAPPTFSHLLAAGRELSLGFTPTDRPASVGAGLPEPRSLSQSGASGSWVRPPAGWQQNDHQTRQQPAAAAAGPDALLLEAVSQRPNQRAALQAPWHPGGPPPLHPGSLAAASVQSLGGAPASALHQQLLQAMAMSRGRPSPLPGAQQQLDRPTPIKLAAHASFAGAIAPAAGGGSVARRVAKRPEWAAIAGAAFIAAPLRRALQAVRWKPEAQPGSPRWWQRRLGTLMLLLRLGTSGTLPPQVFGGVLALLEASLHLTRAD